MASEDLFASANFVENDHLSSEENEEIDINDEIIPADEEIDQPNIDERAAKESEENEPSSTMNKNPINKEKTHQEPKLIQLPLSKIRSLMKLDPDLQLASTEAVFAVAKATEMFIESLAREAYTFTSQSKKKTIQKRDVDLTFTSIDSLMFLEGAMNFD